MEPITTRIGGHVEETVELPVPTKRLPPGAVLQPEDIHIARVNAAAVRAEVARVPSQAIGMQLKRQVLPGQPLGMADLMRPAVVQRDSVVRMQLDSSSISLTGQGIALEAGAIGERIRVRNPVSRALLEAEVVGPGVVRVFPGFGPLPEGVRNQQVSVR
jgi:flagella basal body P-ring formation protein FlgA